MLKKIVIVSVIVNVFPFHFLHAQSPLDMMPDMNMQQQGQPQTVVAVMAPQWLTPAMARQVEDHDTIQFDPKSSQFTWTPPALQATSGVMPRLTYDIRFVELLPGQHPDKAIDRAPVVYERKGLLAPTFLFPPSLIPSHFQTGKTYVVRVQANVEGVPGFTTAQLIQNSGKSDLMIFTIKE